MVGLDKRVVVLTWLLQNRIIIKVDDRPSAAPGISGYAKGGRERDSRTELRLRRQKRKSCDGMLATRFSTNSRALSHDRAMLVRGGS